MIKRSGKPLYSVVIPVYNSSESVAELAERASRVFADMKGSSYELILVDDGSTNPATWATLERIARNDPRVRAVQLARNFGQSGATICGMSESRGDFIITMDDDLQQAPEDIPALLASGEHDVVTALFPVRRHGLVRRLLSSIRSLFERIIIGTPKNITMSSFRLMKRSVVDGLLAIHTPHPYLGAMIYKVTTDVVSVNAGHHGRSEGKSGYGFIKLIRLFSNLLINNSALLLRGVGLVGILMSGTSFCAAAYLIYRKLTRDSVVEGWTSLMVAILFIGGMVLFSMGVIGEYLVRIISGVESMPAYIVRKRVP